MKRPISPPVKIKVAPQEKMPITSAFTIGEYVDMDKGVQLTAIPAAILASFHMEAACPLFERQRIACL